MDSAEGAVPGQGEAAVARGPDPRTLLASGLTALRPRQIQKLKLVQQKKRQLQLNLSRSSCGRPPLGEGDKETKRDKEEDREGEDNSAGRRRLFAFRFDTDEKAEICFRKLAPWLGAGYHVSGREAGGGGGVFLGGGEAVARSNTTTLREILGLEGSITQQQDKEHQSTRHHMEEKDGGEQDDDNDDNSPFASVKCEQAELSESMGDDNDAAPTQMMEVDAALMRRGLLISHPPKKTPPKRTNNERRDVSTQTESIRVTDHQERGYELQLQQQQQHEQQQQQQPSTTQVPRDDYFLWSGGLHPTTTDLDIQSHIRIMIRRFLSPGDTVPGVGGDAEVLRANHAATMFAAAPMSPRLNFAEYLDLVDDVLHRMQMEGELSVFDDGHSSSDEDDDDDDDDDDSGSDPEDNINIMNDATGMIGEEYF